MATDDKSKKRKAASGDAPRQAQGRAAPATPPEPRKKKRAPEDAASDDTLGAAPPSEPEREAPDSDEEPGGALVVRGGESISLSDDGEPLPAGAEHAAARAIEDGDGNGDAPATQLGVERYVMAAFFAAGLIGSYILGKTIHGVWANLSNRSFFTNSLPALAAVSDDDKTTIGMVIGGIVGLIVVVRAYRRPDVRGWADDVASELTKVKWPTKKDVINSTIVVIAASTVATVYLALLDRLWAFVTNLVYGTGS